MNHEKFLVLDFGGQYNQLIARRVRECSVYCEIKPYTASLEEKESFSPEGQTAFTEKVPPHTKKKYLNWESRSWVSAMVPS